MSLELNTADTADKNWLPRQRFSRDRKANFRLVICNYSSTDPENLAKIRPLDVEITRLK